MKIEHFCQIGSVISLHDWEVIQFLARSGVPKAQIARDLGLARNTVARAVGADSPPRLQQSGYS